MLINSYLPLKMNNSLSFKKDLHVDNPQEINMDVLFKVFTSSEFLKMKEQEELNIRSDELGLYFYKKGMNYSQGYLVEGQNTNELLKSIENLKASKALNKINGVLAEEAFGKEAEMFYFDKIFEKTEEINKYGVKLELKNTDGVPKKDLYEFLSSEKLKEMYDEKSIILDFKDGLDKNDNGEEFYDVKLTLRRETDKSFNYKFPKNLGDFDSTDIPDKFIDDLYN